MKVTLPEFERAGVMVVGDVMLDRYWYGPTSRISPEAPVRHDPRQAHDDPLLDALMIICKMHNIATSRTVLTTGLLATSAAPVALVVATGAAVGWGIRKLWEQFD